MSAIDRLIENIERFEPESADREAAVRRIHYNRDYFSTLFDSKTDQILLARRIYRWYLEAHKAMRRRKKAGVYWDPLGKREKIRVAIPPLRAPSREAYKKQSSIIARQIWTLNQETAGAGPEAPKGPRIKLDEEGEHLYIDSRPIKYNGGDATVFLRRLLKAHGVTTPGRELVSNSHPERIFNSLPAAIREIIGRRKGSRGGYHIRPEYLG